MSRDREVGYIASIENPLIYVVAVKKDACLNRYDYVYIPIRDVIDGKEVSVRVLGQVLWVKREPYRVGSDGYIADIFGDVPRDSIVEVIQARVMILGYKYEGKIYMPRTTPSVGTPVYLASTDLIKEFLGVNAERALCIGKLATRYDVPFCLDMKGLTRHLAIIAATGSGKTWSSVLLIEELLKKNATILVIDPHGEYVHIRDSIERLGPGFKGRAIVISASDTAIGDLKYRINVLKVSPQVLADIAKVPKQATKIRFTLQQLHALTKRIVKATGNRKYGSLDFMIRVLNGLMSSLESPNTFVNRLCSELKITDSKAREGISKVINRIIGVDSKGRVQHLLASVKVYLQELRRIGIYTYWSLPLSKILRPGCVTVVNLAGLNDEVQDHVVYHLLTRIFRARVNYVRGLNGVKYPKPVVIFLEEAHRFAPPKNERKTLSLGIISRIACEGRKFGVYLVVITQRPSRIDQDVLSQCNSQIILRLVNQRDINAVLATSEALSEELGRLIPVLDVGEAIVVGPITPLPLVIKLRDRVLSYGGGDIDLVAEWVSSNGLFERLEKVVKDYLEIDVPYDVLYKGEADSKFAEVYDFEFGILRGRVRGAYVEVRFEEKTWSCDLCGFTDSPCEHVIALIAKAIKDGVIDFHKGLGR